MLDSELLYPEQLGSILLLLLTPSALVSAVLYWGLSARHHPQRLTALWSLLIQLMLGTSMALWVLLEAPQWQGPFAASDLTLATLRITVWPFGLWCYAASAVVARGWLLLALRASPKSAYDNLQ